MEKRREVELVTNEKVCLSLEYFLLSTESYYGIAANLYQDGIKIGNEHVPKLWEEKDKALYFIDFLADNFVTPTTLVEILDEIMSEQNKFLITK